MGVERYPKPESRSSATRVGEPFVAQHDAVTPDVTPIDEPDEHPGEPTRSRHARMHPRR